MEPLLAILSTFNAIFKLIVVAVAGFAATRTAKFDATVRRGFSAIILQYFVPAVVFSQTATSVERISTLADWWYLPLSAILVNGLTFPSIYIISKIFKLEKLNSRVFVYSISFGNAMYIPLALVDSITSETTIFGANGKERGGSYVCAFLLMSTIIYWVFGYSFIQRNEVESQQQELREIRELSESPNDDITVEEYVQNQKYIKALETVVVGNETEKKNVVLPSPSPSPSPVEFEMKISKTEVKIKEEEIKEQKETTKDTEVKQPLIRPSFSELDSKITTESPLRRILNKLKSVIDQIRKLISKITDRIPAPIKQGIKNLCTPPTIATFLGILFILAYPARDLIFNSGKLSVIGRSLKYLGSAAVIGALFVLGGNLSTGPKGGSVKWYVIAIALFVRMVVVPLFCIGIHFALWYYGIIPSDPMYFFVVCVESFTPPALNSSIVMNIVYPKGNEQCASLLFWAYLFSIVTISSGMILSLQLINFKSSL